MIDMMLFGIISLMLKVLFMKEKKRKRKKNKGKKETSLHSFPLSSSRFPVFSLSLSLPPHTRASLPFSLSKKSIAQANTDRFGLRVIGQSRLTQLSSNAALLVPAKGYLMVNEIVTVDPDRARAESIRHVDGSLQVISVHGRGETVCRRVPKANGVFVRLEFRDGTNGSKDLFLHDLHVFRHVGEDGRFDEVALASDSLSTNLNLGSGFLTLVYVPARRRRELAYSRRRKILLRLWIISHPMIRSN